MVFCYVSHSKNCFFYGACRQSLYNSAPHKSQHAISRESIAIEIMALKL